MMTTNLRSARPGWSTSGRGLLAVMLASLSLFGCGGVGTGGTGAFASAAISGFGSIFVDGIEFEDGGASIVDDDGIPVARDGNELRLGMIADVAGAAVVTGPNGPLATAASVRLTRAVVGPVSTTDIGKRTLSVLGQNIALNGSTVFDKSLHGGLASLKAGDLVSVYGFTGTLGQLLATRIEPALGNSAWRLSGTVNGLDAVAMRFSIGATALDYSGAANVPAGLLDGQVVHVRLSGTSVGGVLGVAAFDTASTPTDAAHVEIEGIVAALTTQGRFQVGPLAVDTSAATFDPAPAALVTGAHAEVEGRLEAGVLVAAKVKLLSPQEADNRTYQLIGTVSGLSGTGFVVRGVAVDASVATFVNGSAASLATGVKVHVQGALSADGATVRAATITFT